MLGSYIVRKLAESKKISEKVYQHPLKMRAFAATGEVVTLLNNHRINDLYHLKSGRSITKPLSHVANQMIHSYVFVPIFETRTQIFGVAFNSDRSKQTDLYMIGLEEIISVFSRCANYYAQSMTVFRINDGSGFEVVLDDDR